MDKIKKYLKKASAFSIGALCGTVYGAVVATLTCVAILGLP